MRITGISEISKSRCKVYIDQEFAFVLYKGELRSYDIKEGEEIAEENYITIMQEVLPKRSKLRCMNLLKSREYTEAQLRNKLREGFYPEAIIDQAVDYVASFRYIDDLRYAVDYITYREGTDSRRLIDQKLWQKGISKDTLEKAWNLWEEKGGSQDEGDMIKKLLEKRQYHPEMADEKEKRRLYSYLLRKGFAAEQVSKAMR